ncbi:MAG: hypothetical protein QG590_1476 [Pseudomonadota bacterium]|nr:hypothetical protein [Pseudomonadota bacterium]
MVIIMEMDSGKVIAEESFCAYDDEVLNAGWADVPRVEPRLEEVAAARHEPAEREVEGFLARLYAAQE